MTFLNPLVLIALATAAIPLIIHLINMRKPRRIDFSSLAFLEELRQQTIRRLRIKQWLLLVLRTLAVASLVLAFARPAVKSPAIARLTPENASVVVVLDNSMSMELRDQRGSYFSQASEFVMNLAGEMGTTGEIAIVPLVDDGLAHPLSRPAVAGARLAEITPTHGRAGLVGALRSAQSALSQAQNATRRIFVVSDFQRTNFSDSAGVDLDLGAPVVLVPIGERSVDNVSITRVRIVSSIVEVNQAVTLAVEVQNFGAQSIRNWGLSVYLEGERAAQSTVTLDPGQTAEVSLSVLPRSRGWLSGRAVLEEDAFEYDNERFFTLHVPEERRVLLVRGAGRNTEYLNLALSTRLRDGGALFNVEEIWEEAVSGTFSADFDAVVLLGLRTITSGLATALTSFVEEGGGVFLFAGEEAADGPYNEFLDQIGAGSFEGLSAAPPGATLGTLSRLDREHPLFRGVFESDESDRTVERPSVKKIVRYVAGGGDEQTLLNTSAGRPMLQEVRHAAGRVLIAPFLPEPEWTDLPVRGLFVPLMVRSMYYLTSADDQSGDGMPSGAGGAYRIASKHAGSRLKIVSQTGREWIPEQRMAAQGAFFTLPFTLRTPGTYDVIGGESLLKRFALNVDQLESNLERMDVSEASDRIEETTGAAASTLRFGSPDESLSERIRLEQNGVEIWNVFLTIALVLLIAEMLVAARWKPVKAAPAAS